MERAHLLERQIPERYVAGQLTAEEAAEFEEYLLVHPELVDHVDAARQLKLGLHTLSERGTLKGMLHSRRTDSARWLMAAGIAATAVGAIFLTLRPESTSMMAASIQELSESLRENQLAGEYILVRTRGEPVEITLPKSPAPIAVSVEAPRVVSSPDYSVALVCGGKTLSTVNNLRANPDGMIVVFIDPSTLGAGPCDFHTKNGAESRLIPVRFTPAGK